MARAHRRIVLDLSTEEAEFLARLLANHIEWPPDSESPMSIIHDALESAGVDGFEGGKLPPFGDGALGVTS